MSVPKSRRTLSASEFMHQATEVDKMVGQLAIKLPRRWERTRTAQLLDTSDALMEAAVSAEDVYVTCPDESAMRLGYLTEAHAKCAVLQAKLERIMQERPFTRHDETLPDGTVCQVERPCVSDRYMELVATSVQKEMKLLKGSIDYERKRLKSMV